MATLISKLVMQLQDEVTGPAKAVSASVARLNTAVRQNSSSLGRSRMGMLDASAAAYSLARGLVAPITAAADFERQMKMTALAAEATVLQQQAMSDMARELGRTTSFTATQIGAAMEELAKQGVGADAILGGATKSVLDLAAATGVDLATAAKLAASALTVFKLPLSELPSVVNIAVGAMAKSKFDFMDIALGFGQAAGIAKAAGVEFIDFATVLAAGADMFGSGSDAGTSLKTFLLFAIPKSAAAAAKMKELGIELFDVNGNMKDGADIAQNLHDAFEGLTEQERLAAASEIWGADGARTALSFARMTREEYLALQRDIANTEASEFSSARMEGFWGSFEKLKGSLDEFAISIGGPLNAALIGIMDNVLTPLANAASAAADAFPRLTTGVIMATTGLVGLRVAGAVAGFAFRWILGGVLGTALAAVSAPMAAAAIGAGALAAGGVALYRNWNRVVPVIQKAGRWIRDLFGLDDISGGDGSGTLLGGRGADMLGGMDPIVSHVGARVAAWASASAIGAGAMRKAAKAHLKEAAAVVADKSLGFSAVAAHTKELGRALYAERFIAKGALQVAALGDATERVAKATARSTDRFRGFARELGRNLQGTSVITRHTTALGAGMSLLNRAGDAVVGMFGRLGQALAPVAARFAPLAEALAPFARIAVRLNLLASSAIFVASHLRELGELAAGIGDGFGKWMPTIAADMSKLGDSVATAAQKIGDAWGEILSALETNTSWREFGDTIGQGLGLAADVAIELADAFADVVGWAADVIGALTEMGAAFYGGEITRYFSLLAQAGRDLIAFSGVDKVFTAIGAALAQLAADIEAFVSDNRLVRFLSETAAAAERLVAALGGTGGGTAAAPERSKDLMPSWRRAPVGPGAAANDDPLSYVPGRDPASIAELERILGYSRRKAEIEKTAIGHSSSGRATAFPPGAPVAELNAVTAKIREATASWPEAARAALAAYTQALATGGDAAEAEAAAIAAVIKASLNITVTPVVDASSIIAFSGHIANAVASLAQLRAAAGAAASSPAAAVPVTPRAAGGDVGPGSLYLFGEKGPELGAFGSRGTMFSARDTAAMLSRPQARAAGGGGRTVHIGSITVPVTISGGATNKQAASELGREFSRALRDTFSDGTT